MERCATSAPGSRLGRAVAGPVLPVPGTGRRPTAEPECAWSRSDGRRPSDDGRTPAETTPTPADEPVLRTVDLTKHFHLGGPFSKQVLHAVDGANIAIREREILALVGESGSGKSTVARLLAMVYRPTSGEIYFRGRRCRTSGRAATCSGTGGRCRWCSRIRTAPSTPCSGSPTACPEPPAPPARAEPGPAQARSSGCSKPWA